MIDVRIPCRLVLGMMLTAACGPTIELPDQSGTGSSSGPPVEMTSTATTTPPPPPATSTTSVDSTTNGSGEDESSTSAGFIKDPDGSSCLVVGSEPWHSCFECDPYAQDCPEGEKCMPWANDGGDRWTAHRCSPIFDDPDAIGESCTVEGSGVTGFDSCELATMCWDVDPETLEGTCVPLCAGDETDPQCPAPTECLVADYGELAVCLPTCDPLGLDCDPGDLCVPNLDRFFCVPPREDAPAGGPCEYFDGCAPGLVCLDSETVAPSCDPGLSGCCTPYCDLSAPDPAAGCFEPGQECAAWWEGGAPPGQEILGVCVTPPP